MSTPSRVEAMTAIKPTRSGPNLLLNVIVFAVFTVLWFGFAATLLVSQATLDSAWGWIGTLPLVVQGVVWLLVLPLMAGLWIWQTDWPRWLRLVLIVGLAWANLSVFFPRRSRTASPEDGR